MTAVPASGNTAIITGKATLVDYLASGCKPRDQWKVGTEHEKFCVVTASGQPAPYEGGSGIRALLDGMAGQYGWQPVLENGNPIALLKDGAAVSLEPGGQVELSGAPLTTLHDTAHETRQHLEHITGVAEGLGLHFLYKGFHPIWTREQMPWMPKGRYAIMRQYMPQKGALGLDMMLRTCTIQANLDYGSEADMVQKFRVSLALQPLVTALFANSGTVEGRHSGYASYRAHIWSDTDPDRTGLLPFVFEEGMGFERYVDYILDVPMYFVYRQGRYIDASGQSFRDFLKGNLSVLPGELPTMADWADHLSTAFPEVRLKRYLEMRGADGGDASMIIALPALWTGILYDDTALATAWELVRHWTPADRQQLRLDAAKYGTQARLPDGSAALLFLQRHLLPLAQAGLERRGLQEGQYLEPLWSRIS